MPEDNKLSPYATSDLSPDVLMHRKLRALESSDIYTKADPHKKITLQTDFYKRFVSPYNQIIRAKGEQGVELKDWLSQRGKVNVQKQVDIKQAEASKSISQTGTATAIGDPRLTSTTEKLTSAIHHGGETIINAVYQGVQKLDKEYEGFKATGKDIISGTTQGGLERSAFEQKPWLVETEKARIKPPVKSDTLEMYHKRDTTYMETHYDDSFKDIALKEGGTMTGQLPAFYATGGVLKFTGIDLLANPELMKGAPALVRMGGRMLYQGSTGYLVGYETGENPVKTAEGFAVGGEILHQTGARLFSPTSKYVGKLLGLGGQRLLSQSVNLGKSLFEKEDVTSKVSPQIVALAGSEKQKIHAATVNMLNDLVGGSWQKASALEKRQAVDKLVKMVPNLSGELAAVNKSIVEAQATIGITRQRSQVPEFNNILQTIESFDKTPTVKSVTNSVVEKANARQMVKNPGQIKIGAAGISSPEFEENFTKAVDIQLSKWGIGKDKLVFEDRGHKELFYLNTLIIENRTLGPSKERNKMFNLLVTHLNNRYPGVPLSDLMKMSDNVWTKINNLVKTGHADEGTLRLWRQSEFRPGESPFGHEVDLLREAQAADKITDLNELTEVEKTRPSGVPHPRYDWRIKSEGEKLEASTAAKAKEKGAPVIKGRERRERVRGPEDMKLNSAWMQARHELGDNASSEQIENRVKEIIDEISQGEK